MTRYSLFRVGNIWHYRFQINGARVQRSTGETGRRRAESIAERAYRDARLWSRGEQLIPTLRELVTEWMKVHESTTSDAHLKIVETFGRLHLYDLGDRLIDELSTARVEEARNEHLKTHAAASTNQWTRVIRLLCNWAVRRKVIPATPFSIKLLKLQKRPRDILPASLAQRWLDTVDVQQTRHPGIRTAVRLMLGLGLREVETITARWEWLDWDRCSYTPGITKGREADPVCVPKWLLEHLRAIRKPAGLIVVKKDGTPFSSGFTRNAMLRANETVGVGHITAHRLRGTFATLLSEAGLPIQDIQRAMRHKSPVTTMGYLEVNMDRMAQAQDHIASRFGFISQSNLEGDQVAKSETEIPATAGRHDYRESS